MKAPLSYMPALPAAAGLVAGIVVSSFGAGLWFPISALVTAVVLIIIRRQWIGFAVIFSAIGYIAYICDAAERPSSNIIGQKVRARALVEDVITAPTSTRLQVLNINSSTPAAADRSAFRSTLLIPSAGVDVAVGDIIAYNATVELVGMDMDLPDEIDYNAYSYVNGISVQSKLSPDDVHVINHHSSLKSIASQWRTRLMDLIYRSPINDNTAWFLCATLLGDDSMLHPDTVEQFRALGTAHYLALSGFHVGIIAMFASLLLFPMKTWSNFGRFRHLIVILLIWAYAFICGMSASLVRAATLISIFLLAKVLQRQSSPFNSLAIAVIIVLCASPRELFAPGFQMSFAAVLSILLFAKALNPFSQRRHFAHTLAACVTVPLSAMLGTCVITMAHFHRFPLLFLIPNMALGIMMPVLLGGGALLMISTACGLDLSFLGEILNHCYALILWLSDKFASLTIAEIHNIYLPPMAIVAIVAAIVTLAIVVRLRKPKLLTAVTAMIIFAWIAISFKPQLPDAELYITRQPLRTDIVVRDGDECVLLTSAREQDVPGIIKSLNHRYGEFLKRRSCDSISIADDSHRSRSTRRIDDYIIFDNKTILTALRSTDSIAVRIKPDYLLVSRAAGLKLNEFVDFAKPDTVLIANDLPARRKSELIEHCSATGRPYIDLASKPFSLIIK